MHFRIFSYKPLVFVFAAEIFNHVIKSLLNLQGHAFQIDCHIFGLRNLSRCLSLVEILKLMLGRDSEEEI